MDQQDTRCPLCRIDDCWDATATDAAAIMVPPQAWIGIVEGGFCTTHRGTELVNQPFFATLQLGHLSVTGTAETRLTILSDTSTSMASRIEQLQRTLLSLIGWSVERSTRRRHITLIGFDSDARVLCSGVPAQSTQQLQTFQQAIQHMSARGGTNIAQAVRLWQERDPTSHCLLLTDGEDHGAEQRIKQILDSRFGHTGTLQCCGISKDADGEMLRKISRLNGDGLLTFVDDSQAGSPGCPAGVVTTQQAVQTFADSMSNTLGTRALIRLEPTVPEVQIIETAGWNVDQTTGIAVQTCTALSARKPLLVKLLCTQTATTARSLCSVSGMIVPEGSTVPESIRASELYCDVVEDPGRLPEENPVIREAAAMAIIMEEQLKLLEQNSATEQHATIQHTVQRVRTETGATMDDLPAITRTMFQNLTQTVQDRADEEAAVAAGGGPASRSDSMTRMASCCTQITQHTRY